MVWVGLMDWCLEIVWVGDVEDVEGMKDVCLWVDGGVPQ